MHCLDIKLLYEVGLAVLLLICGNGGISAEAASQRCDDLLSCTACSTNSDCDWCVLTYQPSSFIKGFVPIIPENVYTLGACRPKKQECQNLHFGTMENMVKPGMLSGSIIPLPTEARERFCTSVKFPKYLAAPSCEECINNRNGDHGFCKFEIGVAYGFLSFNFNGGICLPKRFGGYCNSDLWPHSLDIPVPGLKFLRYFVETPKDCDKPASNPPASEVPSGICSENLSCKACGDSTNTCTWCGGVVKGSVTGYNLEIDALGTCINGRDASCDNVKFKNLPDVLQKGLTAYGAFEVKKLDFTDSNRCKTVQWENYSAEPNCTSSINEDNTIL